MITTCRILREMPLGGTEGKLKAGNNAFRSKGTAQGGHWEREGIIK